LTVAKLENDFIKNWFSRIDQALEWAEKKKDYKAIVMIEKEKQITIERLIKSGRLASPFESSNGEEKQDNEEKEIKLNPLPGDPDYYPD